jgi:hypothetical protein
MMGGDMGWMMGEMMVTGVLIALLALSVLIIGLIALVKAITPSNGKPAFAPASITLITVAIVGGLAVAALLASGMCGGMFLGGSA